MSEDALRIAEGERLAQVMREQRLVLRLLGGAAVALHCKGILGDVPHRAIGDLDAIVPRSQSRAIASQLTKIDYEPEAQFNALQGVKRMIFYGPVGKLDIFVQDFEMCHKLELGRRLELDYPTITATDLLLTKLQVVQLNAKDALDAALLLQEHELGSGNGDHIDVPYLAQLLAKDWGLWRTVTGTLTRVGELHPESAAAGATLIEAFAAAPKSFAFRARARIGERVEWYELPDDLE